MHQLQEVHDGRPHVHAHPTHVLRNARHQVAGAVAAVEAERQRLVMLINLVFLVVFNLPRHYDKRLAHEKQKDASQQGHNDDEQTVQQHVAAKQLIHAALGLSTGKEVVEIDAFIHQIEGVAHDLGRKNG